MKARTNAGFTGLVLLVSLLACKGRHLRRSTSGPNPDPAPANTGKPMTPFAAPGLDGLTHKPLAVLWQMNPWLMVIGSDVPTVVVYDDGLVVMQRIARHSVSRIQGQLAPADARALAARIDAGLAKSPHHSSANLATDQPTVDILVQSGGLWREASCYGLSADGVSSTRGSSGSEAPVGFVTAFKALLSVKPSGEKSWVPDQIEIMLWGNDGAPRATPWPTDVPAPAASITPPPPGSGVIKHVVAGKYEPALKAYLSANSGRGVRLNGHTWALRYRVRVPSEEFIQKVRRCASQRAAAEDKGKPPPACTTT